LSGCKGQRISKSYRSFHIHIFHNPLTIFDAAIRLSAEIAGEVVMNAGIDFGTSNSTVVGVSKHGTVETFNIDPSFQLPTILRSAIYFPSMRGRLPLVGGEAYQHYRRDIEEEGEPKGRFMRSLKSHLGSDLGTYIHSKHYTLAELISVILREMKRRAEAHFKSTITNIVLGRPVVFVSDKRSETAQHQLEQAARLAGFKQVVFQLEPIAAALAFEDTLSLGEEKRVLIGDLGGGTSDFAVMRLRGGVSPEADRRPDVIAVGGLPIGGDVFTARLAYISVAPQFGSNDPITSFIDRSRKLSMPQDIFHVLCDPQRVHLLRGTEYRPRIAHLRLHKVVELLKYSGEFKLIETVEVAKCQLSEHDSAHIVFEYGHDAFDVVVTRRQFEKAIADETRSLKLCIREVVEAARMKFDDVDAVFITGGSSQVPVIRRIFTDQFGEAKVKESDAFTSVGFGLGLTAAQVFRHA
jgi:hypothetical chaperone protein